MLDHLDGAVDENLLATVVMLRHYEERIDRPGPHYKIPTR
jgi:hypothetical protein